jgi:hypothetical protein
MEEVPSEEVPAEEAAEYEPTAADMGIVDLDDGEFDFSELDPDAMPDDPEAMMAWLEQLAARQGASLEELPSLDDLPVDDPEFSSVLQALLSGEEVEEEETGPVDREGLMDDTSPTPAVPVAESFDPDADIPDDPDEALAWLEQFAMLDEDFPETVEDEVTMIEEPAGPGAEETSEETVAPEFLTSLEDEAFGEEEFPESVVEPAEIEDEELVETTTSDDVMELDDLIEDEVSDDLPDWLDMQEQTIEGEAEDWLDSLTSDMDWLESEELATDYELEIPVASEFLDLPGTKPIEPQVESHADADETTVEAVEEIEPQAPKERVKVTDHLGLDTSQLQLARNSIDTGNMPQAIDAYTVLINAGKDLPAIITDLELASETLQREPLLHRVLGDAYREQGEMQKALNVFLEVLNKM